MAGASRERHQFDGSGSIGCGGPDVVAEVFGGDFLPLPVHAGGLAVVDLHAVHADVALAGARVAGNDAGQRDDAAGVAGPGLQNGELVQVDLIAGEDNFFAWGGFRRDHFREEAGDFFERGEELDLVKEGRRRGGVKECFDAGGDVVERVDVERETHAALGPELVHQDASAGIASDVFKEERGTAGLEFGGAVGDLGHLQVRGNFGGDALDLTRFFEALDPVAEVIGKGMA